MNFARINVEAPQEIRAVLVRWNVLDDLAGRGESVHYHVSIIFQVRTAQKESGGSPSQGTAQTSFPQPPVQVGFLLSEEVARIHRRIARIVRNAPVKISARGLPCGDFNARLARSPEFRRIRVLVNSDILDVSSKLFCLDVQCVIAWENIFEEEAAVAIGYCRAIFARPFVD